MGSEHGLAVKELVPRSVGRSVGLGGREGGRGPFVRVRGGGGGAFKCHVGRRWDRRRRPFLKREKGLGRACSRDVGKRGALKIPGPTGGERAAAAGAAGGMMLQIGLMGKDQGNSLPPLHPAAKSRGERVDDDSLSFVPRLVNQRFFHASPAHSTFPLGKAVTNVVSSQKRKKNC